MTPRTLSQYMKEEFEDFSEGDQEENPELFLTDEDLDKVFAK